MWHQVELQLLQLGLEQELALDLLQQLHLMTSWSRHLAMTMVLARNPQSRKP